MFTLAVTGAIRTGTPMHVPSWALRSSLVYSLELVLATVGALYALLTVAIHTVLRGAVPTTISREGFTWTQAVTMEADDAIASAQERLKSYDADLTTRAEQIAHGRESPS
jgi:hypothetical protein